MARKQKRDYFLRIIRTAKGMSKEELAEKAGIDVSNIWRAEIGKVLSDKMTLKIADVLNISPDVMYYNMGRFPPNKREYVIKDPLLFKEIMDEVCSEPWKLTKTQDHIQNIKNKIEEIKAQEHKKSQHEMNKLLSHLKPTE